MPATPPALLPISDAARRLGIAVETLRDWEKRGRIRAFRTPAGHRRFDAEEVDQLVTARK